MSSAGDLLAALREAVGDEAVRTDDEAVTLAAGDAYMTGCRPQAVVRPRSAPALAGAVRGATSRGFAVVPRGGGLSYTGGYAMPHDRFVTIDTGGLDRIIEIAEEDLYVTAGAGMTWKQLYDALKPRGLRLPFFGTFSGAGATIGGGLSHGALFLGSARYGGASDIVLGLEVALADGTLLRTGQGALKRPSKPVWRGFGPDLTGLFLHDGGAFGIKTEATFRLIRTPPHECFLSFAFADVGTAADALSAIGREGLAEEAYVLEGGSVGGAASNIDAKLQAAWSTLRAARSPAGLLRAAAGLASGLPNGAFLLHLVVSGRSPVAVGEDTDAIRRLVRAHGGRQVSSIVPRAVRADPFPGLDSIVGPDGGRWAALNAKCAHSDRRRLIDEGEATLANYAVEMAEVGVTVTRLFSALGQQLFSYEVVFHWKDRWLPLHSATLSQSARDRITEPVPNEPGRALVEKLRSAFVQLFEAEGLASNQIGRTYPYLPALANPAANLLQELKAMLDHGAYVNPGVLGFG